MTEKEYFEFLRQYFKLFPDALKEREKIEIDSSKIKL
jgi:hypothetical protein